MTEQHKPVARPGETLVHLHFIDPDTQDRSTWIGTSVHRALVRDADGRLCLEVMIDVDGADAPETPAPRGFRVGDLVTITARDGEDEATPPGLRLNGRTGPVAMADPEGSEYSIGVEIDGWLGLVWCSPSEIRHADAPDSAVDR